MVDERGEVAGDATVTPAFALLAFGVGCAGRYGFLFASFTPNGIAPMLKARFGSAVTLRQNFVSAYATTPSAYRRSFALREAGGESR